MRNHALIAIILLYPSLFTASVLGAAEDHDGALGISSSKTIVVEVSTESSVSIPLDLGARVVAQLQIMETDAALVFHAMAPDGREIARISSGYPGTMQFSFPTTAKGRYLLLIESRNQVMSSDRITIRLEQILESANDIRQEMQAEHVYSAAQTLRAKPAAEDIYQAAKLYREAREGWRALHSVQGQMMALVAEAATWLDLSQYKRALSCYELANALKSGSADWQIALLNGRAYVYLDWWNGDAAIPLARQALQTSRATHNSAGEASALEILAEVAYFQSNEDEAWLDLTQATQLAEEEHDKLIIARIVRAKSWVEEDRGHLLQSAKYMREAEQIFRETGDVRDSVEAICDTATIDGMTGNLYSAMMRHSSVLQLIHTSGQISMEGYSTETLGSDYAALNRDRDAIPYFKSAFQLFSSIKHISGEQTSSGELCTSEFKLGFLQQAFAHCLTSERLSLLVHDRKREAIAQWRLGELSEAMGHKENAVQFYRRAALLSESANDPRFESSSLLDLGNLREKEADHATALELYTQALLMSQRAEDSDGIAAARYHVAKAEAALDRFEEAKAQLDEAIRGAEEERAQVQNDQLRISYFALLRKCYELFVDILMTQHQREPGSGFDRLALAMSEAGRARTLLDSISSRRSFVPGSAEPDETPELAKLHTELDQAYEKRLELMLRAKSDKDLRDNAADIRSLISAYDRTQDLSNRTPLSLEVRSRPLDAQQLLDQAGSSEGLILEYALGDERSYLWKIDHGVLTSSVLPGRQVIARDVDRWRSLALSRIRRPGEQFSEYARRVEMSDKELPSVSARLSCTLLGAHLPGTVDRLEIVSDGILQSLPIAALPMDGCDHVGGDPLVTRFEVISLPSISALTVGVERDGTKADFQGDIAILADPVFSRDDPRVHGQHARISKNLPSPALNSASRDVGFGNGLPRLAATRTEAKEIAAMVPPERAFLALDFEASLQTALSEKMSRYRIWHFATHGLLDAKSPDLSGLVFSLVDSDGRPIPGYLQAQEIFSLSLHSELVVLSACNSGLGEQIDGEGTVGLAYAFLHSGARRVISTLWDVDDEASSRLMQSFYGGLFRRNEDPSAALRNAQIAAMKHISTSEPFYWAGYSITQDAH
jgi:CHAT domain-containing protein/tetratricopeptide (TPR) repeat protein